MAHSIKNRIVSRYRSLHWKFYNAAYGFLLSRMRLSYKLPSGIGVVICSFADWAIYNDVFVAGEYDMPIRQALRSGFSKVHILDLGANVGLFLKRVLHIRRMEFPGLPVELICVEGAPSTFSMLRSHMPQLQSGETVQLLHGLAGKKTGQAILTTSPFHAMTRVARHSKDGIAVDYIDLSEVTKNWSRIDLLKCDIEGAEEMVLESYEELLRSVQLGVFEFHLDQVDLNNCRRLAARAGLKNIQVYHSNQYVSVEALSRS